MLVKYPRTLHVPWSIGVTSDDRVLQNMDGFETQEVVVLEKLDGENTSLYKEAIHARSLSSGHNPSRTWVKRYKEVWGIEFQKAGGYVVKMCMLVMAFTTQH